MAMAPVHNASPPFASHPFTQFLHSPGFPGQHWRPAGAGWGGGGAVTVWAASLWPCPLVPLRPPTPLFSAKPRVGQGYTDQHGKSAFRLPGAVFQEQEGLIQAHSFTPTQTGSTGRTETAPYSPQPHQTPPTSLKHKHTLDPARETLIQGPSG